MNRLKIVIGVLLLVIGLEANAALIIDQNQPTNNWNMAAFSQPNLAQSFQQTANTAAAAGSGSGRYDGIEKTRYGLISSFCVN